MSNTRQIFTRDGRYRIELTLTERDLAMHADAAYSASGIFEVATGASIFSLPADTWDAITTIPWGESGVQFRLARIESGTEYFLVVDPARRRYCLDPGLELQLWNDELPEDNVAWHDGWEAIHETINQVFLRAELDAAHEKDEPAPAAKIVTEPTIVEIPQPGAPLPPPLLPEKLTIPPPVPQGFTVDYEEVELSIVYKVHFGAVIDRATGRAVFSLPSGLWNQADTRLEDGTVMVDFSPASGGEGSILRTTRPLVAFAALTGPQTRLVRGCLPMTRVPLGMDTSRVPLAGRSVRAAFRCSCRSPLCPLSSAR